MSKSVEGSYINLTDSQDEIRKKVRSIPTASTVGGEMNEGVKILFTYGDLFTPNSLQQYKDLYNRGTLKFVELKDTIADAIFKELKPFQERRKEFEKNPAYVDSVIKEGAIKARTIASKTVKEVKEKMGLV